VRAEKVVISSALTRRLITRCSCSTHTRVRFKKSDRDFLQDLNIQT
jgi:hypothetical protein